METFSLSQTTKERVPKIPFKKIKRYVVGEKMHVELIFIGETRSHSLNYATRGKNAPANILTFPLSKNTGEIYITLSLVKKDAHSFGFTAREFLIFIFIHGLLHLKGARHGSTMKKTERELFERIKRFL
jgi:rRNA maturation RNase YbeY